MRITLPNGKVVTGGTQGRPRGLRRLTLKSGKQVTLQGSASSGKRRGNLVPAVPVTLPGGAVVLVLRASAGAPVKITLPGGRRVMVGKAGAKSRRNRPQG